jgi:PAS domain S-box-containing protein
MSAEFFRTVLDLIENASLLMLGVIGFCYVRDRVTEPRRRLSEVVQGLIGGALAILTMTSPLVIAPSVQVDSRDSIVVIFSLFGGPLVGGVAGAIAMTYRLWLGGAGAIAGALGIAASYTMALVFRAAIHSRGGHIRHAHLLALGVITAAFVLGSVEAATAALGGTLVLRAILPVLLIVPSSMLLFGAIVLRFDRARSLEQTIAENEARFRAIVDNLPDTLSVRDRANHFLLVNHAYERRFGEPAAELLGRSARDLWEKGGVRSVLEDASARVWSTGEAVRTEPLPGQNPDEPGWVVCTTFPIRNAGGEIVSVGTLTSDVTEMIAAREALRAHERTLVRHQQALTEVLRLGAGANLPFLDEVKPILEAVAEALGTDRVTIWELDVVADRARCVSEWRRATGNHGIVPDERLSEYRPFLDDLERNRVLAVENCQTDERLQARWTYFRDTNVRSCLIAASYLGPKMQAFITLSQVGRTRTWTPEEMTFAQSVAGVVSFMLLTRQHRDALAALDLVVNGIVAEREDGEIIYANRPALALAGLDDRRPWSHEHGLTSRVFPHPELPLKGERDLHTMKWTIDREIRDLEVHRSRLPDGGIISVIIDVTARHAGARERQRLQAQLDQASRMEAIGQLAGGIAHDFNNLLGAISGFAEFLDQDLPPESQQRLFARRILSASERGKALVNQILTFTRVRALERSPLDLREIMRKIPELVAGSMPASVRLALHLTSDPVAVLANEEQITQLLSNLCLNARDALPERGGDIDVGLTVIVPGKADFGHSVLVGSLIPARRYARINVRDSGAGIDPDHLPRIFEPFFTTKQRGRGTGLGLSIVHGIVVSYAGACAVDSTPGRGTSFFVYLPISDESASATEALPGIRDVRGRERVLVVDDEVDITDMLSIGLERLGYEVASVNSGREALEVFREDPGAWDVVVTDHLMPDLLGLDLARRIRAIRPDIVVIVCTGLDDGVVAEAAHKAGIGFSPKPASASAIAASIRDARAEGVPG